MNLNSLKCVDFHANAVTEGYRIVENDDHIIL